MKHIICLLTLVMSASAFAGTTKRTELVKRDKEVRALIKAFEAKRDQRCRPISDESMTWGADGYAQATVSCNQYDKHGEPMANVYIITIEGQVYDVFFDLQSVKIQGVE